MRRIKLQLNTLITFIVTVLATVYVCNLTIAFKRKIQLDTPADFDALIYSSFRDQSRAVDTTHSKRNQLPQDSEQEPINNVHNGQWIEKGSIEADKASVVLPNPAMSKEGKVEEDTSKESENEEDDDYVDYRDTRKYPTKSHVVPILNGTIKPLNRTREWWIRRYAATERRNRLTRKYVASHPNITLPSLLRERAPAFLLIGAQKSGTTALRTYLSKHPLIEVPTDFGETHYFDRHFPNNTTPEQHLDVYVEQFFDRDCRKKESFCIAGENTPIYLFDTERVPARVKQVAPWTKFIVILRDPVKRAISHCNMLIERNEIKDTFEMRLERDFKWLMESGLVSNVTLSETEEVEAWRRYLNTTEAKNRWKKLPIARGFYEFQLRRWFRHFPREQFLILKSEDLELDRNTTLQRVFDFIGIPFYAARKHDKKIHERTYSFTAANDVRDFLYEFYRPYNQKLADLLGPEWEGVWENPKLKTMS